MKSITDQELSIDDKRQVVYSSLFRFSSEAISLRERALHRVVLGALIGSTKSSPFNIAEIKSNLTIGSMNLSLRGEVIQETLNQLVGSNKVGSIISDELHAYFLKENGEKEVNSMAFSSEDLLKKVIKYLFNGTGEFLSKDLISSIFRTFAFECFARFGRIIAKSVTGTISKDELVGRINIQEALEIAIKDKRITKEQLKTIENRCIHFLNCSESNCEKLKFYLTQGFYFTQLVGLERTNFNPLTEQAFSGSIFYLDTNVLLTGILYNHDGYSQFIEMVQFANRLQIELRVSKATIIEAKNVIESRIPQIEKVVKAIPKELIEKTSDDILKSYYLELRENPDLSAEDLATKYLGITGKLKEWGIVLDDRSATEIIDGRNIDGICQVMNDEAKKSRGSGKSEKVLEHDAAHYLAVKDERQTKRAWFLTKDGSFQAVSKILDPDSPSFSFFLIGFLQSISPFISSEKEEMSLADILSEFISDQITSFDSLYDLQELSLMAEYHEDVMSTPPEQLVMAFDYIKSHTLKGKTYNESDIPKVSLELKKFLSADKDVQLYTLQKEKERIANEKIKEREERLKAEKEAEEERNKGEKLEEELKTLKSNIETIQNDFTNHKKQTLTDKQHSRITHTAIGIVLAWILLSLNSEIVISITNKLTFLSPYTSWIEIILNILSCSLFVVPGIRYIKNTSWVSEAKYAGIVLLITSTLAVSDLLSDEYLTWWSDLFGIGGMIATIILAIILSRRGNKE